MNPRFWIMTGIVAGLVGQVRREFQGIKNLGQMRRRAEDDEVTK
jgi:hypothetical protein